MPKKVSQEDIAIRESLILQVACQLIEVAGFTNLTMDRVVSKVPYSKGSVYKLFNSTEEILLAITNDGADNLLELMQRALHFSGNSRQRNLARAFAYHLYGQLYPIHFFCELQAISPAVREKASPQRLAYGLSVLSKFKRLSEQFVTDAIACGDLICRPDQSPSRIANCCWSAEFGVTSYALAANEKHNNTDAIARETLEKDIFLLVNTYMDGLGWQPLSQSTNYEAVWQDIKETLFADELRLLNKSVNG